jgi:putative ABC transport system substrate-binding protein
MRRREFIMLVGGAAAGWPLVARAQQTEMVRRVGVLMLGDESDPDQQDRVRAFLSELAKMGWSEGRNIRIDYRFAATDAGRISSNSARTSR